MNMKLRFLLSLHIKCEIIGQLLNVSKNVSFQKSDRLDVIYRCCQFSLSFSLCNCDSCKSVLCMSNIFIVTEDSFPRRSGRKKFLSIATSRLWNVSFEHLNVAIIAQSLTKSFEIIRILFCLPQRNATKNHDYDDVVFWEIFSFFSPFLKFIWALISRFLTTATQRLNTKCRHFC